jgi:hypothetical protein
MSKKKYEGEDSPGGYNEDRLSHHGSEGRGEKRVTRSSAVFQSSGVPKKGGRGGEGAGGEAQRVITRNKTAKTEERPQRESSKGVKTLVNLEKSEEYIEIESEKIIQHHHKQVQEVVHPPKKNINAGPSAFTSGNYNSNSTNIPTGGPGLILTPSVNVSASS